MGNKRKRNLDSALKDLGLLGAFGGLLGGSGEALRRLLGGSGEPLGDFEKVLGRFWGGFGEALGGESERERKKEREKARKRERNRKGEGRETNAIYTKIGSAYSRSTASAAPYY